MSERTFEIGKPLFFAFLVFLAGGSGIYWWTTRLATVEIPEFSVGLPPEWQTQTDEALVSSSGFLPQGGTAQARVSFHNYDAGSVDWPDAAIRSFPDEPDWTEQTEIGGRRAVLATFNTTGSRALGAVVDGDAGLVLFMMRTRAKYFDRNRSMFERCARSIRCTKP